MASETILPTEPVVVVTQGVSAIGQITGWNFNWVAMSGMPDTTLWTYEIATDAGFTTIVASDTDSPTKTMGSYGSSLSVDGTTYYFRFRYSFGGAAPSAWSTTTSATYVAPQDITAVGPRPFEESSLTPTIYVSPAGGGNGSTPTSTLNLAQANLAVQPGDVVSLRGGTYATKVQPVVSGTVNQRITYQNYPGETPTISNLGNNQTAIELGGLDYITIHGINVDGLNHPSSVVIPNAQGVPQSKGATIGQFANISDATYCIIQHCTFVRGNGYSGIRADGAAMYNIIQDCDISIHGLAGATGSSANGDMLDFRENSKYNIIRYCACRYGGHNLFVIFGEFNVVEYCIFNNTAWDGNDGTFDTVNGYGGRIGVQREITGSDPLTHGHTLYQYNLCEGSDLPWDNENGTRQGDCHRMCGWENITRFNTYEKAGGNAIDVRVIVGALITRDNWIYNNTIVDWNYLDYVNFDSAFWINGNVAPTLLQDNMFLNNAVGLPANPPRNTYECRNATGTSDWGNNRVWNNSFEDIAANVLATETAGTDTTDTIANRELSFSEFANNSFGALNNSAGGDDLTTITSATGSGTTFRVAEAYGFFPGISELGMAGDTIVINRTGSVAVITGINYATGDITVASSVTWTQGDGVSLQVMVSQGTVRTGVPIPIYDVFPISPAGFLVNDSGITNPDATYYVTDIQPLDGRFEFSDYGGAFSYTRGAQTGPASFVYTLLNYDGVGSNSSSTVTVIVE